MKKIFYFLLLFSSLCYSQASPRIWHGVTHGLPIGRVGDYLLWYIKAKYIAYKYGFPFLLNPPDDHLQELQRLALFKKETLLNNHLYIVDRLNQLHTQDDIDIDAGKYFYAVSADFSAPEWQQIDGQEDVIGWKDVLNSLRFRNILREMICLTDEYDKSFDPPSDCISIALHIRTGQAWDTDGNRERWYYKFPTIDFYQKSLKKIIELFPNQQMHVSLFTDDPDPGALVNQLIDYVGRSHIKYRWRSLGNGPNRLALEDLEAMKQYDCLIRGMSGFAQVAHLLGDYKVVMYPQAFEGRNVTQIGIILHPEYQERLKQENKLP